MRPFFFIAALLLGLAVLHTEREPSPRPRPGTSFRKVAFSTRDNADRIDDPRTAVNFADSAQTFYGQRDAASLRRLLRQSDERAERWLCFYRLYPLTENDALLEVPAFIEHGTAREFALLAGLWGYRAANSSFTTKITAGRRSMKLLEEAEARAPNDPFALLIDAQSLLFRPGLFGGDDAEALDLLRRLRRHVARSPARGISLMEVDQWIWYALKETDRDDEAGELRRRLLAQDPPPLYRDFLRTAQ